MFQGPPSLRRRNQCPACVEDDLAKVIEAQKAREVTEYMKEQAHRSSGAFVRSKDVTISINVQVEGPIERVMQTFRFETDKITPQ